MPRVLFYLTLWVASALVIVLVVGNGDRPLYVRLVAHGIPVQGAVSAIVAARNNTLVDYTYVVDGQTFCGRGNSWWPNPRAEHLHAGQPVTLTYNSQQPAESLLGDPRPRLKNENISIIFMALLIPSILVSMLYYWPHRQPRRGTPHRPIQPSHELARRSRSLGSSHPVLLVPAAELSTPGSKNVLRSFYEYLFPATDAVFRSHHALPESIAHLRTASVSGGFGALFRQVAVGSVSEEYVQLHRSIPYFRNMFTPFFIGSFSHDGDGVILSGRFASAKIVRIYNLCVLSFVALFELLVIIGTLSGHATVWWAPFPGIVFFALCVASIKMGQWFARNDVAWLSHLISQALTSRV